MLRVIGRVSLSATTAVCALGCATQLQLIDRGPTAGVSPCSFWPPPPSTSLGLNRRPLATRAAGLNSVANRIATELYGAGYPEPHWYPIGLGYLHGFAATTRLEALSDNGTPQNQSDRWSSLYPEAANLRWLTLARRIPLPRPGRYRVFLIAFTDLPLGSSAVAPRWSEDTVMDGPGVSADGLPSSGIGVRRDLSSYRLGVYVYQYERQQDQVQGQISPSGAGLSATVQVHGAGLSGLVDAPLVDTR